MYLAPRGEGEKRWGLMPLGLFLLLISEDLGRPRQDSWSLLTSQFVTQSY